MNFFRRLNILLLVVWTGLPAWLCAETTWEEKDGLVMMEAEATDSRLGKWKLMSAVLGFSGEGYLEFTGNTPTNGPPQSDIEYEFKITRPGLYYLALRCAKEKVGGRTDLANDCYVSLKGDFEEGPNAGDRHGDDAPKRMLKEETKFFGGDIRKFQWSHGSRLDPGGHDNKRVAIYEFKADEVYTLTIHGRSQRFKLDKIAFFHHELNPRKLLK
ncbi:MAG: hypothetical protein AAF649_06780 [Verrucomicrobiota bacterium]